MPRNEIWRYSADMLYMIENPVVREAFFPSNYQPYSIEKAKPGDDAAIRDIINRFEGSEGAGHLMRWLEHAREYFTVVLDHGGRVAGFYLLFNPQTVTPQLLRQDPVAMGVFNHLQDNPLPRKQEAIFGRRWLDAETGERISIQPRPT